MIPSIYPIVGLSFCIASLLMYFSLRELGRNGTVFAVAFLTLACLFDFMWAGDKPTPPPTPPAPKPSVQITVYNATVSNVTLTVVATTNELGMSSQWQARRRFWLENVGHWGPWEAIGTPGLILSTNSTETICGRFVNERRDTQFRLRYGDGNLTDEVTP